MIAEEWLFAEDRQERSYVVHTRAPRFIARVVQLRDGSPAEPVDEAG